MRRLTIFAITEERSNRRKQRLCKRNYRGTDVISTQQTIASQAVQSPHVYSKNVARRADNRIRVIKGYLVKPISLSSRGIESDYELSEWEDLVVRPSLSGLCADVTEASAKSARMGPSS